MELTVADTCWQQTKLLQSNYKLIQYLYMYVHVHKFVHI